MALEVRKDYRASFTKVKPRIFDGVVARTHSHGDALEYHTGPEYRDESELINMVPQLAGLPVVCAAEPDTDHPLGHPDNLIILGVEYFEIGRVISGKIDGDKLSAQIYIHNTGALEQIEDGTKELSLGYRCALDDSRYQRGIVLDHLSVVDKARCGAVCSLRVDSMGTNPKCGCSLATSEPSATIAPVIASTMEIKVTLDDESKQLLESLKKVDALEMGDKSMKKCDSCGKDMPMDSAKCPECGAMAKADCACKNHAEVLNIGDLMTAEDQKKLDDALAEAAALKIEIESLKSAAVKADEAAELALTQAQADLKAEKAAAEKLAGEIEAIKADAAAKVDAAQKARTDADEEIFAARVDARVALLDAAGKVGVETSTKVEDKTVALADRAIKVAIVAKVDEIEIDEKKSADYVDAMFTGAMKRFEKAAASVAAIREGIEENKADAIEAAVETDDEAELRSAMEAKRANKWRPGK